MGYSIRAESVLRMTEWLDLLLKNKLPILTIESPGAQSLAYKINQALASASKLKIPPFEELRDAYKLKVEGDIITCYRISKSTQTAIVYVNNPDVTELFDLLDVYSNHDSDLPLRLPNLLMTEDVVEWLKDKKHSLHNGYLLLYVKHEDVPEPTEDGTETP